MNIDQRDKVIKSFNEDPAVKVLLISLKAGGVALNLTVANYIYIMDPWWNPAAEMQGFYPLILSLSLSLSLSDPASDISYTHFCFFHTKQ